MKTDLHKRIYQAQCIGNIEPIEYMIPYPSLRSVIEGQNIKFSKQVIHKKSGITNQSFYEFVQKTAHWLEKIGLKPKERTILPELEFPQAEILLFGVWHMGAIAVLHSNETLETVMDKCKTNHVIDSDIDLFKTINNFPNYFDPKHKPLLDDEALITFEKGVGIRLSHYNLLVNANSIQKAIGLKSRTRFSCPLLANSSAWVVLKAILPIYCGCIYDDENPEMVIANTGGDFTLRNDLKNLSSFGENELAACPENSAVLALGKSPLHLTNLTLNENALIVQGHSVMMGYLDDEMNESSFLDNALHLSI